MREWSPDFSGVAEGCQRCVVVCLRDRYRDADRGACVRTHPMGCKGFNVHWTHVRRRALGTCLVHSVG